MTKTRHCVSLKSLLYLLVAALLVYLLIKEMHTGLEVGSFAPEITLQDSRGNYKSLSELRGGPILLNFWATWCGSCAREVPYLNELHSGYSESGFQVVGLSIDDEGWPAIESFERMIPVDYSVYLDLHKEGADIYHAHTIPTTYLIDTNGQIVAHFVGPLDDFKEELEGRVEKMLNVTRE